MGSRSSLCVGQLPQRKMSDTADVWHAPDAVSSVSGARHLRDTLSPRLDGKVRTGAKTYPLMRIPLSLPPPPLSYAPCIPRLRGRGYKGPRSFLCPHKLTS